jgi:two-component system, LuxR family, response regulator FixJ
MTTAPPSLHTDVAHDVLPSDPVSHQPTVFVVDDDPAVRHSLRWLMESVGLPIETYASGQDFLDAYDAQRPGCIVIDVRMPGMSGLELQDRLQKLGCKLPMIVLTAYGDVPTAVRAMRTGAVHFFEKPVENKPLLAQIRLSLEDDGKRYLDAATRLQLEARYRRLTPRESQVLEEVVNGFSSKEIGEHLKVSYKTIEAHRSKIMRKMETNNVPHLIRMYMEIPVERRQAIAAESAVRHAGGAESED